MSKLSKKLDNREKIFAVEYLKDLNPERAAIAAGYSKTTARSKAYQWVSDSKHKPKLFKEIQEKMDKRSKKLEISAEYVLKNIVEIGERCMQRVPVMAYDKSTQEWHQKTEINENGEEVGVWEFKEGGALKAQELLGKHLKLFGADSENTQQITVVMPSIKSEDGVEMEFNIGNPINSKDT